MAALAAIAAICLSGAGMAALAAVAVPRVAGPARCGSVARAAAAVAVAALAAVAAICLSGSGVAARAAIAAVGAAGHPVGAAGATGVRRLIFVAAALLGLATSGRDVGVAVQPGFLCTGRTRIAIV